MIILGRNRSNVFVEMIPVLHGCSGIAVIDSRKLLTEKELAEGKLQKVIATFRKK